MGGTKDSVMGSGGMMSSVGFNHNSRKYRTCCCHSRVFSMTVGFIEMTFVILGIVSIGIMLNDTETAFRRTVHRAHRMYGHMSRSHHGDRHHHPHNHHDYPPRRDSSSEEENHSFEETENERKLPIGGLNEDKMLMSQGEDGKKGIFQGPEEIRRQRPDRIHWEPEHWDLTNENSPAFVLAHRGLKFICILALLMMLVLLTIHILMIYGAQTKRWTLLIPFAVIKTLTCLFVGFMIMVYIAGAFSFHCGFFLCAVRPCFLCSSTYDCQTNVIFYMGMFMYHGYALVAALKCISYIRDEAEYRRQGHMSVMQYYAQTNPTTGTNNIGGGGGAGGVVHPVPSQNTMSTSNGFNVFDPPAAPPEYTNLALGSEEEAIGGQQKEADALPEKDMREVILSECSK